MFESTGMRLQRKYGNNGSKGKTDTDPAQLFGVRKGCDHSALDICDNGVIKSIRERRRVYGHRNQEPLHKQYVSHWLVIKGALTLSPVTGCEDSSGITSVGNTSLPRTGFCENAGDSRGLSPTSTRGA